MSLPLAPHKDIESGLPPKGFQGALELVAASKNPELAMHLRECVISCFPPAEQSKADPVIAQIDKMIQLMELEQNRSDDVWKGKKPRTLEQNYQQTITKQASAALKSIPEGKTVTYHYAINPESEYKRDCSNKNPAVIASLDNYFEAWIRQNNMMLVATEEDDRILCEGANGQVKYEDKDNTRPKRVDPQEFIKKMKDPKTGFAQYVKSHEKDNFKFAIKQHEYPQKVAQAERGQRGR